MGGTAARGWGGGCAERPVRKLFQLTREGLVAWPREMGMEEWADSGEMLEVWPLHPTVGRRGGKGKDRG